MSVNGSITKLEQYLREFNPTFDKVVVDLAGGAARIHLREAGLTGATQGVRLSDGTLKVLCLMAAMFNPDSGASLVCIDEPEAGLHPDAVRLLARAIREASQQTQFIIATHSNALVDEFSDLPETVFVCEKDSQNATHFHRLSQKKLKAWLQDYSLGELWRKGAIGGNPW